MPFSFTGFGPWALLLMLVVGIVQHIVSSRKTKASSH